nr:immunoglobulin light chain junction region [Macaca mulatta]
CQQYYSVPHSF